MTTATAPAPIILDTPDVGMDEPAIQLVERDLQRPDYRGITRYLNIIVIRGDRLWRYQRELGPASRFPNSIPFSVIGGGIDDRTGKYWSEHTVGQLIDIWEAHLSGRLGPPPESFHERPSLITRYVDTLDERRRRRRNQSSFGRLAKLQRD